MVYDLWDVESGNIVGTFETEHAALTAVRTLIDLNGPSYARVLSLGWESEDGSLGIVAEGEALSHRAARVGADAPAPLPGTTA